MTPIFMGIIAYVLGRGMELLIPTRGFFRYLNPGPFNKKECIMIVIMTSSASVSALGTEILAVQRLFYNIDPNAAVSIFLLLSSQMAGYGLAGLMRGTFWSPSFSLRGQVTFRCLIGTLPRPGTLLYPTKMLYPGVLPLVSTMEALFKDAKQASKKLRVFYLGFFLIFFWEMFPEWIFPLVTGFSIFCLANQKSTVFTNIFGGTNGNEGLGVLSFCFDWQYISSSFNPLAIPLQAQVSNFIGYILCMSV
jgi:hypothetical protein